MSFLRIVFGAVLVSLSVFAINANADTQATSAAAQAQDAAATAASAAKTAHHAAVRANHERKAQAAAVDINTASAAQLAKIRGIGKAKAEAIVAARSKNGNFKSVDDLKALTNAKGKPLFSEKSFARLQKRLTAGEQAAA